MDITPIHVDFITGDLEDLKIAEINRHRSNLEGLIEDGKLCCDDGRFIVAEFGFKGDTQAVIEQMEAHIENLETNGIKDTDRVPMQEAYMNACDSFAIENDETGDNDNFKEALKSGDITLAMNFLDNSLNRRKQIHDKKECLCYCNK